VDYSRFPAAKLCRVNLRFAARRCIVRRLLQIGLLFNMQTRSPISCPANAQPCLDDVLDALKRFRNYCGLTKIAWSGFPWEKTTKRSSAFPDFLYAALTGGNDVRLSLRKAACSSMAPPSFTGNPGSVYANCETARLLKEKLHARR
jgi:hypothetical protein